MICCDYTRVCDVIDNYGADWSELEFNGLDVLGQYLSSIVLPNNPNFFKQCKDLNLKYTVLPDMDYSLYDFNGVCIQNTVFAENAILPKNKDFLST